MTYLPKPGDRIRVRSEDKAGKVWGRVIDVQADTDAVDVTMGPEAAKFGLKPDRYRVHAPGKTSIRITVELEPS